MRRNTLAAVWVALTLAGMAAARNRGVIDTSESPHVRMRTMDLDAVAWTGGFWADRFNLVSETGLPRLWEVMQDPKNSANFVNLKLAAGITQGKFHGNHWGDGDVYKAVETMAAVYSRTRDPKLNALMDEAISVIAKAQSPDGYIGTHTQVGPQKRWDNLRLHELYNMGHLITAAVVHHRVTGKDTFLKIAVKTADYLYTVFKPRPRELAHFCFNPSQIMGVVELYRVTRNPNYLDLGTIFVNMRGSQPGGTDQNQQRIPLRKETDAVGHSVTGPYLWAGAADVYAENGDKTLLTALERLWLDVTERKMYITGGIAATNNGTSMRNDPIHEAFGLAYQLPNRIAYNETCASLAMAMWGWRMLGITSDVRYADVVEQTLYNSAFAGWGLNGKSYCYTNPLRRYGKEDRLMHNDSLERWESTTEPGASNCYCCPPNITRTVAEFAGWAYSWSDDAVWVNFYGANKLKTNLPKGAVELVQATEYPWEGKVKFTIRQLPASFRLMLRIPGWSRNPSLRVNGKAVPADLKPQTYAEVRRTWAAGDVVELDLGMQAQLVEAHPKVEEVRNQLAVTRGPLVYCVEFTDLPAGVSIADLRISKDAKLNPRHTSDLLRGVTVVETEARVVPSGEWSGTLYRPVSKAMSRTIPLRLIPYFAWNNRGIPQMTVWIPLAP